MSTIRTKIIDELHKSARRNYPRRHVQIFGFDNLWLADLVEMIPYADENLNFKYLLTVIDCFSKKAFVKPIKNKTGDAVARAMEKIFVDENRHPRFLQTDQGREFFNKPFKTLVKKFNIHHYR